MRRPRTCRATGFTLVELLVAIAILVTLSATILFALYGAMEDARKARTRSQVERIHEQLMIRWESYRSRPLPLRMPRGLWLNGASRPIPVTPTIAAQIRLSALRDLMRMEMPDRITDVSDSPSRLYLDRQVRGTTDWRYWSRPSSTTPHYPITRPALQQAYRRFASGKSWTEEFQNAECLYMIMANMRDGDTTALDFFRDEEIGDVDGDGMPEILDGWGQPIGFCRWAPAFGSDLHDRSRDSAGNVNSPDPFDILKVDYRYSDADPNNDPIAIYPLVYSGGADRVTDIDPAYSVRYQNTKRGMSSGSDRPYPNDPYAEMVPGSGDYLVGKVLGSHDDIHSHFMEVR